MKCMMIYKDKAGNKLYKKYVKTRGITQFYGKNKEGKLLSPSAFQTLAKRAGLKIRPRR